MQYIIDKILNQTIYGTSDSDGHLLTLLGIALSLKTQNILELGVRYGDTTLPLLLAAYFNLGTLTSVDINDTEFVPPAELKDSWKFVKMDSIKFLESMFDKDEQFDLVFVDDWHAFGHVYMELCFLHDLVKPSSVILLHDLMYGGRQPEYYSDPQAEGEFANGGPFRAVQEFTEQYPGWEWATIPAFHGLTILRKKA